MTVTLRNIGGIDFTNLSTTIECSDPYITISDNSGFFGSLAVDSIKENTEDPYVVTTSPTTPQGHVIEIRLIVCENTFVDTLYYDLVVGFYDCLIWNPDPTPSSGEAIHDILTYLGYTADLAADLPPEVFLDSYRSVFVCVGVSPYKYVIDSLSVAAGALVDYLNNAGRKIYLEGGDVWYYDPLVGGYDFGTLFGINAVADGSSNMGPVVGEFGTFAEGMSFGYSGANNSMDQISPSGSSFSVFRDGDNEYTCGVANDAGAYRTVGASFELGGLVDSTGVSTKAALLDSIMHFFGISPTGIKETTTLMVGIPRLRFYPNPFHEEINISYSIGGSGEYTTLKIYDATGRLVREFSQPAPGAATSTFIRWDGRDKTGHLVPSGIYFIHLAADSSSNYKEIEKVVLLR